MEKLKVKFLDSKYFNGIDDANKALEKSRNPAALVWEDRKAYLTYRLNTQHVIPECRIQKVRVLVNSRQYAC